MFSKTELKKKFFADKDERILKKGMRVGKRWEGDTELYHFKSRKPIIDYIKQFISELSNSEIDYRAELDSFTIPTPFLPANPNLNRGKFKVPCQSLELMLKETRSCIGVQV